MTITINSDLKPIQFLVTTLHELAHSKTFKEHGWTKDPHGKNWKENFSQLLLGCLEHSNVEEHRKIIISIARNPLSTSSGNELLQQATKNSDLDLLKDLASNSHFIFRDRKFKKIKLLRKMVICEELSNNRQYKIHGLAEVKRLG